MKKRTILRAAWGLPTLAAPALAALLAAVPASTLAASPKLDSYKQVPGAAKLGGPLLDGITSSKALGKSLKDSLAAYPIRTSADGIVLELVVDGSDTTLSKSLRLAGASILSENLSLNRMTVSVNDEASLLAVAAIDSVRRVNPLVRPSTANGSVDGFGDEAHFADLYTGLPNDLTRGTGARIGIISDSFATTSDVFDTDNSDGVKTELLGPGAALEAPLAPGVYTFVVQTAEAGDSVKVFWEINGVIARYDQVVATSDNTDLDRACLRFVELDQNGEPQSLEGAPTFLLGPADPNLGQGTVPGGLTAIEATTAGSFVGDGLFPTLQYNTSNTLAASPLSCAGDGTGYRFFTFRLLSQASVKFEAYAASSTSAVKPTLGLRAGCALDGQEIDCVSANSAGSLRRSKPQQSGDLPAIVSILKELPEVGSDEGAGMAELVYDIAPGASQFFHTGFVSAADFADGVRKLAGLENVNGALTEGCQVIVDDISWFTEPMYQTGLIGKAVEEVSAEGVAYFSAMGNSGDQSIRQVFNDISSRDDESLIATGNDLHRWPNGSGYLPVEVPPGEFFTAFLYWNQPSESFSPSLPLPRASQIDLDLYVTYTADAAGLDEAFSPEGVSEGRISRNPQGTTGIPSGDPVEFVQYQNTTSQTKTVYVAIDHFSGSQEDIPQIPGVPLEFTLWFTQMTDGVKVTGVNKPGTGHYGGVAGNGHRNVSEAFAIAAVNYFDSPRFGTENFETPEIDVEAFSSRGGPVTTFFDIDGLPVVKSSFKPDFAAVDGNNTTFFGGADFDLDDLPNFFGTSAAAPNAAAIAALMKSLKPDLTPAQIRAAFEETVIDVKGNRAGPGRDDVSGSGFIKADAALQYVADNYGVGGGAPSPSNVSFFNFAGGGGWTFESLVDYTAAGAVAAPAGITLTATSNSGTFGFWKSPVFAISDSQIPGLTGIKGQIGNGSLFRATYRVSSSTDDSAKTADFRMRASSTNFESTNELVISSVGSGLASPKSGDPRFYRQYFTQPASQGRFRLYFDLIAFRSPIEAGSSLTVSEVGVQSLSEDVLLDSRLERLTLFSGTSTQGWVSGSATETYAPLATSVSNGLAIGPVTSSGTIGFSFWSSPASAPLFNMERNRLYRVTYRVSSSAAANAKLDIPTFRLRANDVSNSLAALLHIDPMSDSSIVPYAGTAVNYKLYFETPEALVGNGVYLSFDQVFVPGTGVNPSSTAKLEAVRVDSFTLPPQ
ncbi:S8 family serine peptidase [bacterium]|nr:S8 family serine peptidase [bacterium]